MYLLDANAFIEAKQRYYAFDIAPGYWDWLDHAHSIGRVFTVSKVCDEMTGREDELAEWVRNMPNTFSLPPDAIETPSLRRLSTWATNSGQYTTAAVNEFLSAADYYLVAHGHTLAATVVTHETPGTGSKKRVKIPDACRALGVRCVSPFEMLRAEGATLVRAS